MISLLCGDRVRWESTRAARRTEAPAIPVAAQSTRHVRGPGTLSRGRMRVPGRPRKADHDL